MESQFTTKRGMGALKHFLLHDSQIIFEKITYLLAFRAVQKSLFKSPSKQRLISWPFSGGTSLHREISTSLSMDPS
jgi:hypothetical protein